MLVDGAYSKYFVSIGDNLRLTNDFLNNYRTYTPNFPTTPEVRLLFLSPTDSNAIEAIVRSLKINKSPGIDGMSSKLTKNVANFISPVLAHIMNLSFECGVFTS